MQITDRVFWKIRELSKKIKIEFLKKGFVIPAKTNEGDIRIGHYVISKQPNDFYSVKGIDGETLVENLNLPQSAVIIANTLALKNYVDKNIVEKDREYGYAFFEHQQYTRAADKAKLDPYYDDIRLYKFEGSGERADDCKKEILYYFEKLRKTA